MINEAASSDFLLINTHVCLQKPHNFRPLPRYRNGGSDLRLISPILSNEITEIQQPAGSTSVTLLRSCTVLVKAIASLQSHMQVL